jgi:hypothetical protein
MRGWLIVCFWVSLTVPVVAAEVEFKGQIPDSLIRHLVSLGCRWFRPCITGTLSEKIEVLRQQVAPESILTVRFDDPTVNVRMDKDGVPCGSSC